MASRKQLEDGLAKVQAMPDSPEKAAAIAKIQAALATAPPESAIPAEAGKPGIAEAVGRAIPGSRMVTAPQVLDVPAAGNDSGLDMGAIFGLGKPTQGEAAASEAAITANERRNAQAAKDHLIATGVTKFAAGVLPMILAGNLPAAGRMAIGGLAANAASSGDPIDTVAGALSGGLPVGGGVRNVVKGALGGLGLSAATQEAHSLQDTGGLSVPEPLPMLFSAAGGAAAPLMSSARFGSGTKEAPTGGIRNPATQGGRNIEAIESRPGGELNVFTKHNPGDLPLISASRGELGRISAGEGAPRTPLKPNTNEAFGESNRQLSHDVSAQFEQTNRVGKEAFFAGEDELLKRHPFQNLNTSRLNEELKGLVAKMGTGHQGVGPGAAMSPYGAEARELEAIRQQLVQKIPLPNGVPSNLEEPVPITLEKAIQIRRQLDKAADIGAPTGKGGTGIGGDSLRKAAGFFREFIADNATPEYRDLLKKTSARMTKMESINEHLFGGHDADIAWDAPREVRLASRLDKYGAEVGKASPGAQMSGMGDTESAMRELDAITKETVPDAKVGAVEGLNASRTHRALIETKMAMPQVFWRNTGPQSSTPMAGFIDPLLSHIDPALENASRIQPLPLIFSAQQRKEKRAP